MKIEITQRLRKALIDSTHAYFDAFVEPHKKRWPEPFTFWRPDNKEGWKKDRKPLGYWTGHIHGWAWLIGLYVAHMLLVLLVTGYWDA